MKRFALPIIAALLSLSACTFVDNPVPTDKFYLTANESGLTRTTMDTGTYKVSWTSADKLSVFCRATGTGAWGANLEFEIDEPEAGRFVPASGVAVTLTAGTNYDWTAIYPYISAITDAEASLSVPFAQTQAGDSNPSALAAADILKGTASSAREPVITMNHIGALMKWTVKNASSAAFAVSSLVLKLGTDEYSLTVSGGANLASGQSADYYMVVNPCTCAAGSQVKMTVNTTAGSDVQLRTLQSAKEFAAGTYNTATVNCIPTTTTQFSVAKNGSGKWRLYKSGEEFFIKGAAANAMYDKVASFGGNVIRTYNVAQTKEVLATAQSTGVYVLAGVAIGRETDGFDYDNTTKVASQKESIRTSISDIISHPSILGWVIGNEADASYTNSKVWSAVEDIALMIKGMNPHALVTTSLAGCKQSAVNDIKTLAPSIDFLSINSYYPNALNVSSTLASYNWNKPWIISEFGPRGTWALSTTSEPPLTSWDACVEQTSTQKASYYREILNSVASHTNDGCIGSCAFVWGYQKHGAVLTWYGLFDKNGYSFAAVDELQKAWTGAAPSVAAPVITNRSSMVIDGNKKADHNVVLFSCSSHTAYVTATSSASLTYKWMIYCEGTAASDGSLPAGIAGLISNDTASSISFVAPAAPGNYRLVVFVKDDTNKKVASAVIPFKVEANAMKPGIDDWNQGNVNW